MSVYAMGGRNKETFAKFCKSPNPTGTVLNWRAKTVKDWIYEKVFPEIIQSVSWSDEIV